MAFQKLKSIYENFTREIKTYQLVLSHPRTPRLSKWLLGLAVGYAVMPFDLIPDFIPVLGYLDDLIIIPALVVLALKMVPSEVVGECRAAAEQAILYHEKAEEE
jgi:uncharacterized membrane protein YkvA (DUF1232 family)